MGCKPVSTPLDPYHKLRRTTTNLLADPTVYRQLVGRLLYLTFTRPDISFAVQHLAQLMDAPVDVHFTDALRVLKYLKNAPGDGLLFSTASQIDLRVYVDSDWAGCLDTRRSVFGYVCFLGDSMLSWKSKK